jgi:hypothetical protein
VTCSAANGTAECNPANGTCQISACDAGFGDCDGDPTNGCETDLRSDAANCGRCGFVCGATPGQICVNGFCHQHCAHAVLAGSSGGKDVCVDDEITVYLNGVQVYQHLGFGACLGQLPLGAVTSSDSLRVVANNSAHYCGHESLSPLYAICTDDGTFQKLDATGVTNRSGACGEVFYDRTFTLGL